MWWRSATPKFPLVFWRTRSLKESSDVERSKYSTFCAQVQYGERKRWLKRSRVVNGEHSERTPDGREKSGEGSGGGWRFHRHAVCHLRASVAIKGPISRRYHKENNFAATKRKPCSLLLKFFSQCFPYTFLQKCSVSNEIQGMDTKLTGPIKFVIIIFLLFNIYPIQSIWINTPLHACSKQCWMSSVDRFLRSSIVFVFTSSMDSKRIPFIKHLNFGNKQTSWGADMVNRMNNQKLWRF